MATGSHSPRSGGPPRALRGRVSLALLVGLSLALLTVGKLELPIAATAGNALRDAVVPVLAVLQRPIDQLRHGMAELSDLLGVRAENRRLRDENRRLLARDAEAAWLAEENRSLRRMLAVRERAAESPRLTARIVGDSQGTFVRALLLDAGSEQGVSVGMAALAPEGLIGRVVDVGRRSARVLLVTDFNSRIPVVVAGAGDQAVLEGDNSPLPLLRFLPLNPGLSDGDRVLTSGRGGMLPPGLPIGRIMSAGADGKARVRPLVDWSRLDHVVLLDTVPLSEPAPGRDVATTMVSRR
ncbi:MAG: rod shape-determining protein MreC [Geminicoccaceae bacterium]